MVMLLDETKDPRRKWLPIACIGLLAVFVGLFLYTFVPPLLTVEGLEMWSFVGWSSNSAGQVRQASFILTNNGTRKLTIRDFLVNGTQLGSQDFRQDGGFTLNTP